MVKYEEYERAGDGFEDGIGNKKRWGKRGGDREKGGGGETRIRGASRFSVYERVNDSVPMFVGPNDFQRQSEQSLLLRGVVPFLWRSPPPSFEDPLFREEDPLHPFYSAQHFRHCLPDRDRFSSERYSKSIVMDLSSFLNSECVYFWYMMQSYK